MLGIRRKSKESPEDMAARVIAANDARRAQSIANGIMNQVMTGQTIYLHGDPYEVVKISRYDDGDDVYEVRPMYNTTTIAIGRSGDRGTSWGHYAFKLQRRQIIE